MKYKATYISEGKKYRTQYYLNREAAQIALMKRVGNFPYLGKVAGDIHNAYIGYCDVASRLNGRVFIDEEYVDFSSLDELNKLTKKSWIGVKDVLHQLINKL